MANTQYDEFIRIRITELRIAKNISEHKMSLDLDKSGSYIRGITSGAALPSLRELFNIISYFDMTPAEFFAPLDDANTPYRELCEKLRTMNEEELEKVSTFIGWIEKKYFCCGCRFSRFGFALPGRCTACRTRLCIHGYFFAVTGHYYIALQIGAVYLHSCTFQPVERFDVRMSV